MAGWPLSWLDRTASWIEAVDNFGNLFYHPVRPAGGPPDIRESTLEHTQTTSLYLK